MTCEKMPGKVWHKDELWDVYGGCVCCGLWLARTDKKFSLDPSTTYKAVAKPGEWVEWRPSVQPV